MAQSNQAIQDGKKMMKQGYKLLKGGLFTKANPDDAEKLFEKAKKKVCHIYYHATGNYI